MPSDGQPGELNADDILALSRSRLFAGCPAQLVALATQAAVVRHVPHSGFLLQPGDASTHVYVIVEGQLAAYRDAPLQHLVSRLVPGDVLGEHSLRNEDGSPFYIAAQWPTRVVAIEAKTLRDLMAEHALLALNVVDTLLNKMHDLAVEITADEGGAESLEFMSTRDAITGLHNRRWMTETFTDELARADRDGVTVCMLLIDIDYFARLNQTLGRAACDTLLKQVADVIRYGLRPVDMCARQGEDLFVALLPGISIQAACLVAERIRAQIAGRQFPVHGHIATQLTVSIGAVIAGNGLEASMEAAEGVLQRAKAMGRNRVESNA